MISSINIFDSIFNIFYMVNVVEKYLKTIKMWPLSPRAFSSSYLLHRTKFPVLRIHVLSWSLRCVFFHLLCTVSGSFVPSRFGR